MISGGVLLPVNRHVDGTWEPRRGWNRDPLPDLGYVYASDLIYVVQDAGVGRGSIVRSSDGSTVANLTHDAGGTLRWLLYGPWVNWSYTTPLGASVFSVSSRGLRSVARVAGVDCEIQESVRRGRELVQMGSVEVAYRTCAPSAMEYSFSNEHDRLVAMCFVHYWWVRQQMIVRGPVG